MKRSKMLVLCAGGVLALASAAQAQFVDSCVDATEAQSTGTFPYDLSFASNDGFGTCGATDTAQDLWLLVNPPTSGQMIVETCGLAGGDSVLEAWTSCGETVLACNDDFCGLQSTMFVPVTAGQTFLIRIADFAGGAHAGSVHVFYDGADLDATGFVNPTAINQGGTAHFEVNVIPATLPPSTSVSVTCDLSLIGGSSSQTMYDDGTNGDVFPGDNNYSVDFTTDINVSAGDYQLPWTAADAELRSISDYFFLTILPPGPTNDNCADAQVVTEGTTSFDSTSASTDGTASCIGTTSADVWFQFVPTQSGIISVDTCGTSFDTVLSATDGCGGAELGCNDDSCGLNSRLTGVPVTAGHPVIIRVARYFTGLGGPGVLNISVPTQPQWDETVNGGGDSGGILATAQVPTGADPFRSINGNIEISGDTDMYRIRICDVGSFNATTGNADTLGDTQLFLFNDQGMGVTYNDDTVGLLSTITNTFVTTPGTYYLAIARYNTDPLDEGGQLLWANIPFNVERAPDGPGAANPIASWDAGFSGTGTYKIDMAGVCFDTASPPCDPDFNQDGNADQDDVRYLTNVVAGGENPTERDPDFNQDGNVDQDDVRALVNVVAGGNCP